VPAGNISAESAWLFLIILICLFLYRRDHFYFICTREIFSQIRFDLQGYWIYFSPYRVCGTGKRITHCWRTFHSRSTTVARSQKNIIMQQKCADKYNLIFAEPLHLLCDLCVTIYYPLSIRKVLPRNG
jgi:hypothetical protein